MKLFFSAVIIVFALFLVACGVGYFLPSSLTIERSTKVEAYSGDVFPYLNDLTLYKNWAALDQSLGNAVLITGGAETGVGQSQVWQEGPESFEYGTRDILQSQSNEFVQLGVAIMGHDTTMTYAVLDNEDDTVTILSKYELPQPGFPYLGRLRTLRVEPMIASEIDQALARLKLLVEANLDA